MANQIVVSAGAKVRNLSGVLTATSGVVSFLPIDVSMGIPQLDVNGKILVSQLPNSVMEYKGTWNAATNTPTLVNGTGNQGDVYLCNVAGTVNFGAGAIAFVVGDQVIYSGSIWQRASGATGTVTSVAITESGDSLNITGSPITTSGTINIGFNGTNLQYVNGAGNLTTFPDLTGFVPYTGATANVNIGTHSFIANNGTYNSEMSPSLFGVENAAGTIFGVLEYNKLTLTNSTGAGSVMEVNAQGLIFPDASVQISSYTDAKARLALSLTTTGTSGVATYNNTTGVFNIPNYGSALSGYVPYTGATADVDLGAFKLNAQSLHIKGTAGNGHLGLKHQSASATASANEVSLFADTLGDLSWLNGNLYLSKFITSGNTAARSYTFPNATCNIPNDSLVVHLAGTETITGAKTFSGYTTFTSTVDITSGLTFSNSGFTLVLQPPTLSVNRTVTLPNATGTLALTSDIPSITGLVPYTGATTNVTLGVYSLTANQLIAGGAGVNNVATFTTYDQGNALQLKGSTGNLLFIPYWSPTIGARINAENTAGSAYTPLSFYASIFYFNSNVNFASTIGNGTYTYTLPSATGTLALTSQLTSGTVTSVAALTIGTSGTDLSSSVANSTTTPVITLNVPTASATNRGALSSADWSTFNSKQGTITLTTTGTSGAATFSSNTLNIPNYGSALSGYLPLTGGTLTGALNGTSASFSSSITADGVIFQRYLSSTKSATYLDANRYTIQTVSGYDIAFEPATVPSMIIKVGGNVGIGTTSPQAKLDVNGQAMFRNRIDIYNNGYGLIHATNSTLDQYVLTEAKTNGFLITTGKNGAFSVPYLALGVQDGESMRITSGGNVLIGTTTDAGYKLDVNGTGRFSGNAFSNSAFIVSKNGSDTIGSGGFISLQTATGTNYQNNIQLNASGGLDIWTYNVTDSWVKRTTFANNGAATFSSSVTATGFFESSDSRLKTLIQDNYQTKGIASITPKLYTKNGKVELGYYAQDFVGILDSAISKGSDDMLSLSYREVHTAKIYALEQEIKELKAKMN